LVRNPEWGRGAVRNAPGVGELRIGDLCQIGDVRNQIGLNKFGVLRPHHAGIHGANGDRRRVPGMFNSSEVKVLYPT